MCATCGGQKAKPSAIYGQADPPMAELLKDLGRYGIQSLTINNYGSLTIFGDLPEKPEKQAHSASLTRKAGGVRPQGWETASIQIKNETEGPLRKVWLEHRFDSGDTTQGYTWENVGSGQTTSTWSTSFYSGWGHGNDDWRIHVTLEDGGIEFFNSGWKQCNLQSEDVSSEGDLTFTLQRDGTLNLGLASGGCTTSYLYTSVEDDAVDAFGWIKVENKMTAPISDIHVWHDHQDVDQREYKWSDKIAKGGSTGIYPVYFSTNDLNTDKWNIQLMRDGDTKPHKNSNKNKWCSLNSKDQGKIRSITVDNEKWKLGFSDNACTSGWEDMTLVAKDGEDGSWTEADSS